VGGHRRAGDPERAIDRRGFLRRIGAAGAAGGLTAVARSGAAGAGEKHPYHDALRRPSHGGMGVVGTVNHGRNGFDPHQILTDFDGGSVSRDASGRTVREYEFLAYEKRIEIAPGVFFPAWTYNGRVPGPTIRATEGDRVRVTLRNGSSHPHSLHFHGIHPAEMDGLPGSGEVHPGESFVYDFIAEPFGTHLYHCHSMPLKAHIHRGLYGAFIVDPPTPRPPAHEMVMVMNGFDVSFVGKNQTYAVNTVAFAYLNPPIQIGVGELQRLHLINITEFDLLNSFHLHANFFHLYRTGTSLEPHEFTDTISMGQAERHMLEFTYRLPGRYVFHAHQSAFMELGWMSAFEVV
jgi:FtsP/CotA-like multicopper oxidase with cupredoxin domain